MSLNYLFQTHYNKRGDIMISKFELEYEYSEDPAGFVMEMEKTKQKVKIPNQNIPLYIPRIMPIHTKSELNDEYKIKIFTESIPRPEDVFINAEACRPETGDVCFSVNYLNGVLEDPEPMYLPEGTKVTCKLRNYSPHQITIKLNPPKDKDILDEMLGQ